MRFAPAGRGQGFVEYAFILLLVALVVILLLSIFGTSVGSLYSQVVPGL